MTGGKHPNHVVKSPLQTINHPHQTTSQMHGASDYCLESILAGCLLIFPS